MTYKIGSFNIRSFSIKNEKDYDKIVEIIRNEKFDILAIQEIKNKEVIEHCLMSKLNKRYWDFCVGMCEPRNGHEEGYAFLWKKSKFKLIDADNNPEIYNRWISNKSIVRPPYVVRLASLNVPFEFRLISTHVTYNSSVKKTMNLDMTDKRRQEINVLVSDVFRKVALKRYGNNLPAYTFLLGDFNMCIGGSGNDYISSELKYEKNRNIKVVQHEKTTLKKAIKNQGIDLPYSMNYDHFAFDEKLESKMIINATRVDALSDYQIELEDYNKKISDHVPIKLEVNLITKGE